MSEHCKSYKEERAEILAKLNETGFDATPAAQVGEELWDLMLRNGLGGGNMEIEADLLRQSSKSRIIELRRPLPSALRRYQVLAAAFTAPLALWLTVSAVTYHPAIPMSLDVSPTNLITVSGSGSMLKTGTCEVVPSGSLISGDVVVEGISLFDDKRDTGQIVVINKESSVCAPWGAGVTNLPPGQDVKIATDSLTSEMKQSGCLGGCREVKVVSVNQ